MKASKRPRDSRGHFLRFQHPTDAARLKQLGGYADNLLGRYNSKCEDLDNVKRAADNREKELIAKNDALDAERDALRRELEQSGKDITSRQALLDACRAQLLERDQHIYNLQNLIARKDEEIERTSGVLTRVMTESTGRVLALAMVKESFWFRFLSRRVRERVDYHRDRFSDGSPRRTDSVKEALEETRADPGKPGPL